MKTHPLVDAVVHQMGRATEPLSQNGLDESLEQRRKRMGLRLQWGLSLLAAAALSPLVYFMLKGLLGLAAAVALGLVMINVAQPLSMRLANWRMNWTRQEVQAHPIDVLEAEEMQRREALAAAYDALAEAKAAHASYADDVVLHARAYPADAEALLRQGEQSRSLVLQLEAGLSQVETDLEAFRLQVARARSSWNLSLSQQRLAKAAGQVQGNAFDRWKTDTALEATRTAMHRSFAHLDMVLQRRNLAGRLGSAGQTRR